MLFRSRAASAVRPNSETYPAGLHPSKVGPSFPIGTTLAFELGLRRSFRYRYELLLRVLFRARMWETIPLPDFLFGIYPLLSPFEWAIFRLLHWIGKPGPGASVAI